MQPFKHELSPEERHKVTQAITATEAHTTGEIVVVAARESDDYIHVPLHIAAVCALAVPLLAWAWQHIQPWGEAWTLWGIFLTQLVVFVLFALVLSLPPLRRAITPAHLKRKYAHRNAASQFLATNIAATRSRTGVLIFVSMLERYVEVIGDEAIAAKLTQADWQKVIDEMLPMLGSGQTSAALVLGVERCGALLACHFPAGSHKANELPDRFIVLE